MRGEEVCVWEEGVVEMACMLKRLAITAVVEWTPRTANTEADSLVNIDTRAFDPANRLHIATENIHWETPPPRSAGGGRRRVEGHPISPRIRTGAHSAKAAKKRRKKGDRLRVTVPW